MITIVFYRERNFIFTWKEIGISYHRATLVICNAILSRI